MSYGNTSQALGYRVDDHTRGSFHEGIITMFEVGWFTSLFTRQAWDVKQALSKRQPRVASFYLVFSILFLVLYFNIFVISHLVFASFMFYSECIEDTALYKCGKGYRCCSPYWRLYDTTLSLFLFLRCVIRENFFVVELLCFYRYLISI